MLPLLRRSAPSSRSGTLVLLALSACSIDERSVDVYDADGRLGGAAGSSTLVVLGPSGPDGTFGAGGTSGMGPLPNAELPNPELPAAELVPPAQMNGGKGGPAMPEAAMSEAAMSEAVTPAPAGPLMLPWPPPLQRRLTVGFYHGCVLRRDNTAVCWNEPSAILPPLVVPSGRFTHLASSDLSTCGLREDGSVSCWGDPIGYSDIPPTVRLAHLEMGMDDMACGLQSGQVSCWGAAAQDFALPDSTTYRAVASGITFSCGIDRLGDLVCTGDIDEPPTDGPFVALAAGGRHACALRENRTIACWGLGDAQDPIDGTDELRDSWGQAIAPPGEFAYIAAGSTFSCALRIDGEIICWGEGKIDGGCLNGGFDNCGTVLPPPGPFVELALDGGFFGCGLRPDNSVSCWGGSRDDARTQPPPGPL